MSPASKYSKKTIIGRSPSGLVYRGKNTQLESDVVIKELSEELRRDAKQRERYFQEARDWAVFSHRHLVKYADLDESRCWIIMEPMQSNSLPLLRSAPLDPATVRDMLQQALEAIGHLHNKGFLHLNLKPTNLLLDADRVVKVSDGRGVNVNDPGVLPRPRSHKYIAPELLDGSFGHVGPSSDLYCLGFMFLELLVGPRFDSMLKVYGSSDSARDVAWSRWHVSNKERIPGTHDLVPNCPSELAIVIDGLIAKESRQRYQSTDHPLEELIRASTIAFRYTPPPIQAQSVDVGGKVFGNGQPPPVQDRVPRGSVATLPDTKVVLRVVSGSKSGEAIGVNSNDIHIGATEDCHVRFDPHEHPQFRDQRIVIRREAAGWQIVPSEEGVMVNDRMIMAKASIRSGDVIRMSWRGPDFQFLLQSPGAPRLSQLAEHYLGISPTSTTAAAPPSPTPPAAEVDTPIVAKRNASVAPVEPKLAADPRDVAPRRPAEHPNAPSSAASVRPAAPVINAAPAKPAAPVKPTTSAAETQASGAGNFFNVARWSKKTKNTAIAVVGSLVALIVVYAIPTGGSETPSPSPPASTRAADFQAADRVDAATVAKN